MLMNMGPGRYRLGLALLVLVHHSTRLGLGPAAVYVFFCLSGYWMHAVWESRYAKLPHGYATFMVARYFRLLPLFWVCGFLAFVTEIYLGKVDPTQWLSQTHTAVEWLHVVGPHVFILGYNWLEHMTIVPAWSLDVEVQFYLLLPLLAVLVRSIDWLILPLAAAIAWAVLGTPLDHTVAVYLLFFLLGMLSHQWRWRPRGQTALIASVIGGLWVVALVTSPSMRPVLIGGTQQGEIYRHWNELANAALALIVLPLTVWTASLKADARDRMWGDMSYAVYLIHAPVLAVYSRWFGHMSVLERLPYWFVMIGVVLGVSWVLWRWIDAPMMSLRNRFLDTDSSVVRPLTVS